MGPTPEEAAIRLITNFKRDMGVLLDSINTERLSSKESPFTSSEELDKLASMFSEESVNVGKDATKG